MTDQDYLDQMSRRISMAMTDTIHGKTSTCS
jgi:hypothetical protein